MPLEQLKRMKSLADTSLQMNSKLKEQQEGEIRDYEEKLSLLRKAQIVLYGILGLFDKAVKMSLTCQDIELAKVYANKPTDKKLKKKLWMKIAKYLFNYQSKKS